MPIFAELSLPWVVAIVNLLGLPGLILVFWYVDGRRMAHYQIQTEQILKQYKDDVGQVTRYYESNVELVERYEKTAEGMSDIIVNNTIVYSRLIEKIDNNLFCPILRERGPGKI